MTKERLGQKGKPFTWQVLCILCACIIVCACTNAVAPLVGNDTNEPVIIIEEEYSSVVPDPFPDLNCRVGGTTDDEPENPINAGRLDDRTCYANYEETTLEGNLYVVYSIVDNSNHKDTNGLQPRIERTLTPRVRSVGGNFSEFSAIVRIGEVGITGSYLAQTKGKHTGG